MSGNLEIWKTGQILLNQNLPNLTQRETDNLKRAIFIFKNC